MNSRLKQLLLRQCFLIIAVSFSLNHLALAGAVIKIDDAKYENDRLIVKGEFKGDFPDPGTVKLYDALTNELITALNKSEESSHFSLKVYNLKQVPCYVKVQAGALSAIKEVEHAPEDCSSPPTLSPPAENQPLACSITSPVENSVHIALGESVLFAGAASDPEDGVLTYEWDFSGGADVRPRVLSPGAIAFNVNNNSFLVYFIVTDKQGARCTASMTVGVGDEIPGLPVSMVPQQPAPIN